MADEVGLALLDATRRLSIGRRPTAAPGATNNTTVTSPMDTAPSLSSSMSSQSSGWFSNSSGSTGELEDKTGSLPKSDGVGWFGGMGFKRHSLIDIACEAHSRLPRIVVDPCDERTVSESDGGRVKIDVLSWLQGPVGQPPVRRMISEPNGGSVNRIRRSSSKDVEEAMAGGLNKADIYMPPF